MPWFNKLFKQRPRSKYNFLIVKTSTNNKIKITNHYHLYGQGQKLICKKLSTEKPQDKSIKQLKISLLSNNFEFFLKA